MNDPWGGPVVVCFLSGRRLLEPVRRRERVYCPLAAHQGAKSRVTSDVMCFTDSGVRRRTSHSSAIRFHRESAASLPVGVLQHLQSSNLGPPYKMLTSRLFGYSTLTLASGLGSAGANWDPQSPLPNRRPALNPTGAQATVLSRDHILLMESNDGRELE